MSRPAARFIHQRIAPCPTCDAPVGRACTRVRDGLDAGLDHGWTVTPHKARRDAEQALREKARRA